MNDIFSAEHRQLLRNLHIPLTTGYGEGVCSVGRMICKNFIIALSSESVVPGLEEIKLLRSYQLFKIKHSFKDSYVEKLLAMEYPADPGWNTLLFRKNTCGWQYRRMSWTIGPAFMPQNDMILPEVLQIIEKTRSNAWETWLANNANLE